MPTLRAWKLDAAKWRIDGPVAVQGCPHYAYEPEAIVNHDSLADAAAWIAEDVEDLRRVGQPHGFLIFHGPVQDDEHLEAGQASYLVELDRQGRLLIQGLDTAAWFGLAEDVDRCWS